MIDAVNFIPWGFTLISILITIYTLVKKTAKEDTSELTTVIVKLESIKDIVSKTNDTINDMQDDLKALDRRVTTLETLVNERTAHG